MDRNTTLAFVIIGLILIVWLYLNSPTPPPKQKGKTSDTTLVRGKTQPELNSDTLKKKETVTGSVDNKKENADTVNYGKYFLRGTRESVYFTIENEKFVILLSTKGANIQRCYLKNYNNWYSPNKKSEKNIFDSKVQLINYNYGGSFNLSFITADGKAVNTSNLDFKTDSEKHDYKITGNDSLIINFTYNSDKESKIIKQYVFYGDKYAVKSNIEFVNMNQIISNNAFDLVWGNGIRFTEENSVDESSYADASVYYGGEQVLVDASSNGEKVQKDFSGRVDWIAVRNKYFAAVVAPLNPDAVQGAFIEGTKKLIKNNGENELYSARLILPFNGTTFEKESFLIYLGPIDYDILKSYGHRFEAIVDFGSFFGLKFIIRPISEYILLPLFTFLHSFIPNYGIVIIVFSLIIKFVLYPLTKSSFQSMKKMQMLQPKIAELKEKYKDDAQKLNKETMKLYSTYGINPAGGCLPLLLQMPIFVALWGLFRIAIELRQQPFIFWIKDLSQPDVIFDLGFKFPIFGIQQISGLAVLMGVTTFFQQKMSVKDPKQQSLVYIMPIFLTLMFMSFPSGLNLYYFMFNVFSIAQQFYINRKHDGMELQPVKKSNQKKGFMARMMEAAEQNAKTQQQKRKR